MYVNKEYFYLCCKIILIVIFKFNNNQRFKYSV